MGHIFISYNQSDADFAAVLSIHIEKAGVDTWMDKSRLRPGQDWSVEIDDAIINSHALIVIMSPEAKASEYVTYEWSFALGANVRVIPVLYKETTLHPRLARLQYLKFTDPTVRPWDVLIETVTEAVSSSGVYLVRIPRNAPPYVKSAVLALDSANDADREGAIRVLSQTDHPAAKEALISALQHPIKSVRWDAALRVSEDPRAVPILTEAFINSEDKYNYAEHLANSGPTGLSTLIELLITVDDYRAVSPALARFESREVIPKLLKLLHDPEPEYRRRAVHALGAQTSELVDQELIHALEDTDPRVRAMVVRALNLRMKDHGKTQLKWEGILTALQDSSIMVRDVAVEAFYLINIPDTIQQRLIEIVRTGPITTSLSVHKAFAISNWEVAHLSEFGLLNKVGREPGHPEILLPNLQPGSILLYHNRRYSQSLNKAYCIFSESDGHNISAYKIVETDDEVSADLQNTVIDIFSYFYVTNLSLDMHSVKK